MQYTYNLVEAAALWAGVDPIEIQRRMERADKARAEIEYAKLLENAKQQDAANQAAWLERLNICDFQCEFESTCPDWKATETEDGDIRQVLRCPHGFVNKPIDNQPVPITVAKPAIRLRLTPSPGEFDDCDAFRQRFQWLQSALNMGDLEGSQDVIRARDLRAWMQSHFPGQQPDFLFATGNKEPSSANTPAQAGQSLGKQGDVPENGGVTVHTLKKGRTNALTPVIERVINEKGTDETAVVYTALREFAKEEVPPFQGLGSELRGGKKTQILWWVNSNGELKALTSKTLDGILSRRRKRLHSQSTNGDLENSD
ncbi:hypothetical protein QZM74_28305 [Burkholderia multivorans]|nr:hypothetical protein [Burkholderia multivorans]